MNRRNNSSSRQQVASKSANVVTGKVGLNQVTVAGNSTTTVSNSSSNAEPVANQSQLTTNKDQTTAQNSNASLPTKQSSSNSISTAQPTAASHHYKLNPSGRFVLLCVQNVLKMGARTQLYLCPPGKCRQTLQVSLYQRISYKQQQLQNMSVVTNATGKNAINNPNTTGTTGNSTSGSIHTATSTTITLSSSSVTSNKGVNRSTGRMSTTSLSSTQLQLSDPHAHYFKLDYMIGADRLEEYEVLEEEFLINATKNQNSNSKQYDDVNDSDEEASTGDDDELIDIRYMFSEEPIHLDDDSLYHTISSEPLYTTPSTSDNNVNGNNNTNTNSKLPFNRKKIRYFDQITADEMMITRNYLKNEYRRCKQRSSYQLCFQLRQIHAEQFTSQQNQQPQKQLQNKSTTTEVFNKPKIPILKSDDEKAILETGISLFDHPMTPAMAAALLLESLTMNPIESIEGMAKCYDGIVAAGVALLDTPDPTQPMKARPKRSEIMAALAPLLITSLEQPSGDVIMILAKLRRMCGTVRYRRRFVQRIAPALIRPPDGAMWCLKHQNDMVAIFAATELILDAAFDVFGKGWYERGRWMLADSKRAETLSVAAKQLRNLSQESPDSLTFLHPTHRNRNRRLKRSSDHNLDEPLAEWEVIAVDRQIRISISNVFHTDWTRAAIHETIPRPIQQRTASTGGSNLRPRQASITSEMSPRAPRSPRGNSTGFGKAPASPLSESSMTSSEPQPPFSMPLTATNNDRAQTPPPPTSMYSGQQSMSEHELSPKQQQSSSSLLTMPQLPKSPKSYDRKLDLSPRRPSRDGNSGISNNNSNTTMLNMSITPLSPSASSIGSASEHITTHKPNTVGSMTLTSTTGPTAHYRMLTSTAAERKRTVAACRALRAQIQRFEDAFVQLHGRPPKGAGDRAPLATTYAQYREWKRAIRADAACRIQALFRGARCRWSLLRTNNPKITRIVRKRAGRTGTASIAHDKNTSSTTNINNKIAIPFEIDNMDPTSPDSYTKSNISSSSSPQWDNQLVPPRMASHNTLSPNDGYTISAGVPSSRQDDPQQQFNGNNNTNSTNSPSSSPSPTDQSPDSTFMNMSFAELQARKRDLKQQLKQYDMNFARKHGRMPVKSEKEPIRHLYESYNTLKSQITELERDGRHLLSNVSSGSGGQPIVVPPQQQQRTVSPTSGSDSGTDDSISGMINPSVGGLVDVSRAKRKLPKPGLTVPPVSGGTTSNSGAGGSSSNPLLGQDLISLKAEKQNLHTMLRSFEKDFFRENRRQVSSFADIRPVASQYRRYKEIKKQIASLQQQQHLSGGSSNEK
jgi:hypothetical protein